MNKAVEYWMSIFENYSEENFQKEVENYLSRLFGVRKDSSLLRSFVHDPKCEALVRIILKRRSKNYDG